MAAEFYVLKSLANNRNNYNLRQSPKLLSHNQPTPKPSRNSYKQKTEIYYVPENKNNPPIYSKQPHKSPTPSINSADLPVDNTPGLYHLPARNNANNPTPGRKIYYRPLRLEPKRLKQQYKPPSPPVKRYSPVPPAPVKQYSPLPPAPVKKSTPSPPPPVFMSYPLPFSGPELYHLNGAQNYHAPTPVEQSYKSPSPPVTQSYPTPPPPVQKSAPPPSPPINTFYSPTQDGPELYHLNGAQTYNEPIPVEQPYTSPPPRWAPVKWSTPLPPTPVNTFYPSSQDGPELYHINLEEKNNEPIQPEPQPVQQPYKSPSPPVQKSPPPPLPPVITSQPLPSDVPELYHIKLDEIDNEPIQPEPQPVQQPYKSPPPPVDTVQPPPADVPELYHIKVEDVDNEPTQVEQPSPPVKKSTPPPTPPVNTVQPPSRDVPELYHMKVEDIEPQPEEPPYKPPTPPVAKSPRRSPVPVANNRVSPVPSEKSYTKEPEIYHLITPVDNIRRSPSINDSIIHDDPIPTPIITYAVVRKRERTPSPRTHRTAAPLTLPVRKQAPIRDPIVNEPYREPSFTTKLHDVLTADRLVPLSTSKASDSILRSMNKFRFNGN